MYNKINVYSEIGKLKKVLVHTPGQELEYLTPQRLDELLFSAILEPSVAIKEHQEFVKILESQDVEVVQLTTLVAQTYKACSNDVKEKFIQKWLDESIPKLSTENRKKVYDFLKKLEPNLEKMIRKMMSGILASEIGVKSNVELVVDPMPNLYFTRDPFASVGNGVTIHHMHYPTRQRETIFADFIFENHPDYKNTPKYYNRTEKNSIEGGDIFVYNSQTLVIGDSERTGHQAIESLTQKIKNNPEVTFKKIYAVNVPKMANLMHLDTWLTMLDHDKFLYSPNIMGVLKLWEIDLTKPRIEFKELNKSLEDFLSTIIGKKATLIPVAGKDATHIQIDVETHFDATNYLVVSPDVVIGYDRNKKTAEALMKAGIKVLPLNGNQLSLGMGSARCMSMPLYREPIKV